MNIYRENPALNNYRVFFKDIWKFINYESVEGHKWKLNKYQN